MSQSHAANDSISSAQAESTDPGSQSNVDSLNHLLSEVGAVVLGKKNEIGAVFELASMESKLAMHALIRSLLYTMIFGTLMIGIWVVVNVGIGGMLYWYLHSGVLAWLAVMLLNGIAAYACYRRIQALLSLASFRNTRSALGTYNE